MKNIPRTKDAATASKHDPVESLVKRRQLESLGGKGRYDDLTRRSDHIAIKSQFSTRKTSERGISVDISKDV